MNARANVTASRSKAAKTSPRNACRSSKVIPAEPQPVVQLNDDPLHVVLLHGDTDCARSKRQLAAWKRCLTQSGATAIPVYLHCHPALQEQQQVAQLRHALSTQLHTVKHTADAIVLCMSSAPSIDAAKITEILPHAFMALPPSQRCDAQILQSIIRRHQKEDAWAPSKPWSGPSAQTALLLRNPRTGKIAYWPSASPPPLAADFGKLLECIQSAPPAPGQSDCMIFYRLYLCLEVRSGITHVLPAHDRYAIASMPPAASVSEAMRLLIWSRDTSCTTPENDVDTANAAPLFKASQQIGEQLLSLPELIGNPASSRIAPIIAIDFLPGASTTAKPIVLGLQWATLDPSTLAGEKNLCAWLALAAPHLRRRDVPPMLVLSASESAGPPSPALNKQRRANAAPLHPLEPLFPTLCGEPGHVNTRVIANAEIDFVCAGLLRADAVADTPTLLEHLARITTFSGEKKRHSARLVEPGVGRTYLVDGWSLAGRPELTDFTITGGGLTPYSIGGYLNSATFITGRAALERLRHRQRCGWQLEHIGGRTSPVLAIFRLPGETAPLPNGEETDAGLALRGFRSVLRVRQLDPVAGFYQSIQHAPLIGEAILQKARLAGIESGNDHASMLHALDRYAGGFDDIRAVLWPHDITGTAARAQALRRWLVSLYAPAILELICARLARELQRDSATAPVSTEEYVTWFAHTMGKQLALWRDHRFLHDYHKPGIERYSGLMTLVESNVTLLAEFPDLDTAIFVDDEESAMSLQLSTRDQLVLRNYYNEFHLREVEAAKAVVKSLACAATGSDAILCEWAETVFSRAYAGFPGSAGC